jgi:hypothetical protein
MTEPQNQRRGALMALVLIIAIVLGSLLIQRVLRHTGQVEDCLLAGRRNCAPLDTK